MTNVPLDSIFVPLVLSLKIYYQTVIIWRKTIHYYDKYVWKYICTGTFRNKKLFISRTWLIWKLFASLTTQLIICPLHLCDTMHKTSFELKTKVSCIMKSFGFFSCIWLGWILGFLQLSPPWRDPPSFNSWKSWISVWSLIVLCVQHVLLIDFSRQTKLVDGLAVNLLAKQLHALMFIVTFGAFWTVRVIFLIRAKKLAKLLGAFYVYPIKNEYFRWRVAWRVAVFFVCISGILVISSSGLFVLAVRSKSRAADSPPWFFIFGKVLSGILSAFFGHMASMASTNVAFALVIYISFYLGMIYCDFCNELEEFLNFKNKNTLFSKEFVIVRDANSKKLNFLHSPLSKEILLNKFEGIRTLFEEGNKIIAPLALVVIVVETFRGVSGGKIAIINVI